MKSVSESPEFSFAKDDPLSARYTLYPVIVTPEPEGADQLRPTWCGFPVPLNAMLTVGLVDALLVTVSCPVADPVAVGLKVRVTLRVCPGFRVAGRLTAEEEKPLPFTEIPLTVTAAVPLDVSVTV